MTLPDFLGIGAQRAGSSWLERQLRNHPEVYLSTRRKEVHFFDLYYDRGIEWYKNFFPKQEENLKYKTLGEITPKYMFDPEVPARIYQHIPNSRLIAILRNPIDRAYSQYGLMVWRNSETRSFKCVLDEFPDVFTRGLYYKQLCRYYQTFPRENLLVLIFEKVMQNPEFALSQIAEFLLIDLYKFNNSIIHDKVNPSGLPKFPKLRAFAMHLQHFLRDYDLDWVTNIFRRLGVRHIFKTKGDLPPMDPKDRESLYSKYENDTLSLEKLLNEDLSCWKE